MVCSFCSQGLVKILKSSKDILAVRVDLEGATVDLTLSPEALFNEQDIKEKVVQAGFQVRFVEFTSPLAGRPDGAIKTLPPN